MRCQRGLQKKHQALSTLIVIVAIILIIIVILIIIIKIRQSSSKHYRRFALGSLSPTLNQFINF